MKRWALVGAALGALCAVVSFAPAAWLARSVAEGTEGRLQLSEARGTVWRGSAVLVLTGGAGSRDASALPGRLQWTLGWDGAALALRASQACCIEGELKLRVVPGWGRLRLELPGNAAAGAGAPSSLVLLGQWPARWLVGLGTPWNTIQPTGTLQLSSAGLVADRAQGRWTFSGQGELQMRGLASTLSTLEELGSYRLLLQGHAPGGDKGDAPTGVAALQLSTTNGVLLLSGTGQWAASKLRFQGQASAAPGSEAALGNLLNIIGRRQGALSLISIG
jgi:general secretion pathway protein N